MPLSQPVQDVLGALSMHHNVVLTGPPAVGKTHLMQEVADAFKATSIGTASTIPRSGTGRVGIPPAAPIPDPSGKLPSSNRPKRYVDRIAFSANTKSRDFTSAFVPNVANTGGMTFRVETGALLKANEAALAGAAALLIIDELNRGPAVQLFGDGIVAIDASKRLKPDDSVGTDTFPMRVLDSSGQVVNLHLSSHLYILCSMNQADTSIEPLDVAFMRRFHPHRMHPDAGVARSHLGASGAGTTLPGSPAGPDDVMEVLVRAWAAVNGRIADGRSEDFQIGHGVFMDHSRPANLQESLEAAVDWWRRIEAHSMEVFYGDGVGASVVLNAGSDPAGYRLVVASFGDDERQKISIPEVSARTIYDLLLHVARS